MTIDLTKLITLLFIHWLFDFVLQTRNMANNKSKSNLALAYHVFIYFLGLFVFSAFNFYENIVLGIAWTVVNAIAHFITDYGTSRLTSTLYQKNKIHAFFTVIGFDQFIHISTLCITYVIFNK
jgi:hypothetical protein